VTAGPEGEQAWFDAVLAAALFAVAPATLGGVVVRALPGPVRERWLAGLQRLLPRGAAPRRVPVGVSVERLLGGLDLAATLRAGRPVTETGLLADSDGGVLLLAMAERLAPATAAVLGHALELGEVTPAAGGSASPRPARFGLVALDEGLDADERPPAVVAERLAFALDLTAVPLAATAEAGPDPREVAAARQRLADVHLDADTLEALCAASIALGVGSLRAPLLAASVARVAAALAGADEVGEAEAALAVRLVLLPRATALPESAEAGADASTDTDSDAPTPEQPPPDPPPEAPAGEPPQEGAGEAAGEGAGAAATEADADGAGEDGSGRTDAGGAEQVLDAAAAVLPPDVLTRLRTGAAPPGRRTPGRSGTPLRQGRRGRPAGVRRGTPGAGERLSVVDTLRAAAPWQRLRRDARPAGGASPPIEVRREDFRVQRYRQRSETTTVFAVDASGSTAMSRLAEAKGAVELLLSECYVRRDRVALVGFRGAAAEVLLPPTRSLARARRSLAGLPGGGGTPLASGLDAARTLAEEVLRRGGTPMVVLLTDGRANVDRQGIGGRSQAAADALAAARALCGVARDGLVIDTSAQPRNIARGLAEAMGAGYLALPQARAGDISEAVRERGSRLGA